jgi:RNA-binding protein NOB1
LDQPAHNGDAADEEEEATEEEDDGEGEWISTFTAAPPPSNPFTNRPCPAPTNIKKYRARENAHTEPQPVQRVLQAALITGDMAMRNVALRINLKYVTP